MIGRLLKPLSEVGMYGAASAVALAVDIGLLHLLTSVLHIYYLVAATISFVSGGVVLYALSVKFIFRTRRLHNNRTLELSFFLALGLVGLVINSVVIYAAVETASVPVLGAKLLAAGFTFGTNFILRRFVLFSTAARAQGT